MISIMKQIHTDFSDIDRRAMISLMYMAFGLTCVYSINKEFIMKRIFSIISITFLLVCSFENEAKSAPLFNASLAAGILTISPTIKNRVYSSAGIQITTPGVNTPSGCTPHANGYCIFSMSSTNPAVLNFLNLPQKIDGVVCLNGIGVLSCQKISLSNTNTFNLNTSLSGVKLTISPPSPNLSSTQYTNLGIKLVSSGNHITGGCTPNNNGYCIFSTSTGNPANIYLSNLQTTMSIELCFDGFGPYGCQIFAISNPISLYVGTQYGNLLSSSNGGNNWTTYPLPGGGSMNFGLYFIPSASSVGYNIYVGGSNGNLLVSTDGGQSWANTGTQPDHTQIDSVYILDKNTMYVGTSGATNTTVADPVNTPGNAAYSTDGGTTWTKVNPAPPSQDINNSIPGIGFNSTIFALSSEPATGGNSLYSYNGTSWQAFYTASSSITLSSLFFQSTNSYLLGAYNRLGICNQSTCNFVTGTGTNTINGNVSASSLIPGSPYPTYFVGTQNNYLQVSTDGGNNWYSYVNYLGSFPDSLFIYNSKLYVGDASGNIYWTSVTSNPNTAIFNKLTPPGGNLNYGLFIDDSNTMYLGGTNGNVLSSSDHGQSWSSLGNAGSQGQVYTIFSANGSYYAATQNSGIQVKANAPNTYWHQDGCTNSGESIYALSVIDSTIYYGGYYVDIHGNTIPQVYTEDTATLSQCNRYGPSLPFPTVTSINSMYIQNSNTIYVGTNNGIYYWLNNSGMVSWQSINAPANVTNNNVWGLFVDKSGSIYATWDDTVYVSSDSGTTWVTVNTIPDGSLALSLSSN